jgi:hypothetical protein
MSTNVFCPRMLFVHELHELTRKNSWKKKFVLIRAIRGQKQKKKFVLIRAIRGQKQKKKFVLIRAIRGQNHSSSERILINI